MPSRCLATRYASLRVPQCSVFSILAPFSAQVCSIPEITFLTSSSGVAGRAIKIRSYKRSSMMTSSFCRGRVARENLYVVKQRVQRIALSFVLCVERLAAGLFFFSPAPTFRGEEIVRPAPVSHPHRRVHTLREKQLDRIACFTKHLGRYFQLRLPHRPEHIFPAAANLALGAGAQPEPRELLRADRADHRLRTVVAAGATVAVDLDRAEGQLHFVPHHEQIARFQFVLAQQLSYGNAAEIHVRLRLCQHISPPGKLPAPPYRLPSRAPDANRAAVRNFIDRHKTQIVRRPLIFRVWIPKPHNEPHKFA